MRHEVGHAGSLVVSVSAAQLIFGDFFMGDGLDDIGTGDEHVGSLVHHHDEIGDRRRIHGAPAHGPMIAEICGTTPL